MVQFGFISSQENLISIWGDVIPNSQKSNEKEVYPKAKSGIFKIAQLRFLNQRNPTKMVNRLSFAQEVVIIVSLMIGKVRMLPNGLIRLE